MDNNKGFTLIELLATIVILSLVMGIAGVGVVNTINNSRDRSEKLFVQKLSKAIDDYIDLYGSTLTNVGTSYTFSKKNNIGNSTYDATIFQVKNKDKSDVYILDLVSKGLIDSNVVNPRNKLVCFDSGHNPVIKVYKDSDYVYYYSVDLSSSNCEISSDNNIIDTLPEEVKDKFGG